MILNRRETRITINLKSANFTAMPIITLCLAALIGPTNVVAISFQDVSSAAGIYHSSQSFGCSWGDLNGDGYPDLYSSNHWLAPNLYLNDGAGAFVDVASLHDVPFGHVDVHGAAWGDYDNDGDQDLVTGVGGTAVGGGIPDTPFFINQNGVLTLHDPADTGLTHGHHDRTPTWIDENLDGYLDLLMASKIKEPENYSALLMQSDGYFSNQTDALGLANMSAEWAMPILLGEPTQLNRHIIFNSGTLFFKSNGVWQDISQTAFPPNSYFSGVDYAIGDINGDGYFDLYSIREGNREQVKFAPDSIEVSINTFADLTESELPLIEFEHAGTLSINYGLSLAPARFYLGASATPYSGSGVVQLSSADPIVQGKPNVVIPNDTRAHVFVWYVKDQGIWRITFGSNTLRRKVELTVSSNTAMQNLALANILADDLGATSYLFLGGADGQFTRDATSAIKFRGKSRSGVFADFDNDMDLDLYIVNRNLFDNPPNQLFENLGGGNFVAVANAGGAEGTTLGSGDAVSVADYDLDGYLDMFVVNGTTDLRDGNYEGPQQLFRNTGSGNHWLQFDLIGTDSNRDGNGALVEVFSNGVRQLRYQDGGMHRYSQHFSRLHFGMAQEQYADKVVVTWPSGSAETFYSVPTDQILEVYEAQREFKPGFPVVNPNTTGVYIFKTRYDGPYYMWFYSGPSADTHTMEVLTDGVMSGLKGGGIDAASVTSHYFSGTFQNDIVEFQLDDADVSLISVSKGGAPAFHHVSLGNSMVRPRPAAWIMDFDSLPAPPTFSSGVDLGTFLGVVKPSNAFSINFNGDGKMHRFKGDILGDRDWQGGVPLLLEVGEDSLDIKGNRASIGSTVASDWDGAVLITDSMNTAMKKIGIRVEQDGFLQTKSVNFRAPQFHRHNAFLLPKPQASGTPSYDPAVDPALYIWQDATTSIWHVRITGGGTTNPWAQFKGRLTFSADTQAVLPVSLENNDILQAVSQREIRFHLQAMRSGVDGMDITLPAGTVLTLDLENGAGLTETVYVGKHKWKVDNFPVVISQD